MSNSYMKSAYFQTQVNQANRIKECYPCGTGCNQIVNYYLPTDLTLSSLTVTGKATILGLIDPTGLEFTPVTTNPGGVQANTIWVNSTDANKLYFGASPITGGGGGGGVNSVTAGTNISTSGTASDPIINFAPGGTMNMNGAQLTSVSTVSVSSISDVSLIQNGAGININANSANAQININTSGTGGTTNITSRTVNIGDNASTVNGVIFSVSDVSQRTLLTTTTGGNVSMYLQTAGIATGYVEMDDTTGLGIKTLSLDAKFQSGSGSVAISGSGVVLENAVGGAPNTTLTVGSSGDVNIVSPGTTASLSLSAGIGTTGSIRADDDGTGNGTITLAANYPSGTSELKMGLDGLGNQEIYMTTNGGGNQLKQSGNATEIVGNTTSTGSPLLIFNDIAGSGYSVNLAYVDIGAGRPSLFASGYLLGTSISASQGFTIGYDAFGTTTNCAFGNDNTATRISYSQAALATDYIELTANGFPGPGIMNVNMSQSINLTSASTIAIINNTIGGQESITFEETGGGIRQITLTTNNYTNLLRQTTYYTEISGDYVSGNPAKLVYSDLNGSPPISLEFDGISTLITDASFKAPQILDAAGSAGSPSTFLIKNGAGTLSWVPIAVSSFWSGTALTDLNMNGFKITDNASTLNLQATGSNSVVVQNSDSSVKIDAGEDALGNKRIEMTANSGTNRLVLFGAETWITGNSIASPATLRFYDDIALNQIDIAYTNTTLPELTTTAYKFHLAPGALNADMAIIADVNTGYNAIECNGGDVYVKSVGASVRLSHGGNPNDTAIYVETDTSLSGVPPTLKFLDTSASTIEGKISYDAALSNLVIDAPSINLLSASTINLTSASTINVVAPVLELSSITSAFGSGAGVSIEAAAAYTINNWLPITLNGNTIWIPYLTTDPSV